MSLHDHHLSRAGRNVVNRQHMLREALDGLSDHQNIAATEIARWNVDLNGPKAGALADVIVAKTQAEMRSTRRTPVPHRLLDAPALLDASDYPGEETIPGASGVVPMLLGAALLGLLALGLWWAAATTTEASTRQAAEWREWR